jgi:hypothetical protein
LSAAGGLQLPFASTQKGESHQEYGGTDLFYAESKENQASSELYTSSQELSGLLEWPLYSTDLGRSPDYRPFDGSLVGEEYWYQSSLFRGFTDDPEHGDPFTNVGDTSSGRDNSSTIPSNWAL